MAEPDPERASPARRRFAPTVLVGLAAAALTAVTGNRTWVEIDATRSSSFYALTVTTDETSQIPLATALALVVLAGWGVLLVTRGRARRVVAVLASVAALGTAATVVVGARSVPTDLRADLASSGLSAGGTSYTPWFYAAAAGALLSVLAAGAAVRWVGQWPAMGSRYDAPRTPARDETATELELWKAFDEGRDPTV